MQEGKTLLFSLAGYKEYEILITPGIAVKIRQVLFFSEIIVARARGIVCVHNSVKSFLGDAHYLSPFARTIYSINFR
jgi:energy-converting hydrogenase Eha subunit G